MTRSEVTHAMLQLSLRAQARMKRIARLQALFNLIQAEQREDDAKLHQPEAMLRTMEKKKPHTIH